MIGWIIGIIAAFIVGFFLSLGLFRIVVEVPVEVEKIVYVEKKKEKNKKQKKDTQEIKE